MSYKRLEIYVWWTCNQKCTYCIEFANMEKTWNKKVTRYDILKKLIKYKKLWYNHVTYLWWEPFIQEVFYDALKIAKKLWYTTLVTTNATTLHIEKQASKFLPLIDQLFLSVQGLDNETQQKISRTKVLVYWPEVFENIAKYWNGNMLKGNIVITQDNLHKLGSFVEFLNIKWVKEIAITYPDLDLEYYTKEHTLRHIAPRYYDAIQKVVPIVDYCSQYNIRLKLPDFPYCVFPKNNIQKYIYLTDDYDYQTRVKIDNLEWEIDRWDLQKFDDSPRERWHVTKCNDCIYKSSCWWPSVEYEALYGLDEIQPQLS